MNKEQAYDSLIFPLMNHIIAVCKEHKIALVASFAIPSPQDDGLCAITALLAEEYDPPPHFLKALATLRAEPSVTILTVRDANGEMLTSEAII